MLRTISHLLAALVNNASDFKRRWNQDMPAPTVDNGLQGRWQGEWISEVNGHRGALRCVLAREKASDYRASFHAVYGQILRVCYTIPLRGQWSNGKLLLEGDADLGSLAGGIYRYKGEAGEKEFVCLYQCKYDHGTFRMKPAPQESIKNSSKRRVNIITPVALVVLACGLIVLFAMSQRTPEAYYEGRSASSWLRGFFATDTGGTFRPAQAAEQAFTKMGTNAEPVLLAALRGKANPFVRIYRCFWVRMPETIQRRLPKADDPALLRMAAVVVLQNSSSSQILPDLYPLFKEPDSGTRLAVLEAVNNQIPDSNQMPLLMLAGNDPDPYLRAELWRRVSRMGKSAGSAAPAILQLCGDGNIDVRQDAAWALWKITRQTNIAVPVLESVLSQNPDAARRHTAAYHLLVMGDSDPLFVNTLINSLTNSQAVDRAIVCTFLGQLGPTAVAAIPALRKARQDPEETVRHNAEVALSTIETKHK